MKKIILLTLIMGLVMACNSAKKPDTKSLIDQQDVAGLRARQAELVSQNNTIKEELNRVMQAIDKFDKTKKKSLVTVFPVEEKSFKHNVVLQGIVKTDQNLVLNAEFMGAVKTIHVKEGQEVKKGDLLVSIDDGGLAQNAALQKVQLDLAKTLFERQERLWKQNIGSEIEYLQAKTAYQSQQKGYEQLQQQLSKSTLYAPFSGRVDDIITEVGQLVSPGAQPLLRLVNLSSMYVEVDVPERFFPNIKKGTTAEVEIPVLNHTYDSNVIHKGTHISTGNRTFKISIAADKTIELTPNLISTVRLVDYQNPNAIVIPLEVISENFSGEQYVYVVNENNKAEKRFVKTGLVEGDTVEVLEGLRKSDRVIDEGARLVKENENVQITNAL
ncbi:MAG: efflux RND transporter periplasmic adaptor subunit [Bacteroidetes bacterium]|nr:efflux RND transporter periplasmic adaptor subunit [Bacteroidota bacterium]MDA0889384.1 efflux RND transporter periplasmic adaptor subunit [Bacteroidota bacterium]MDA1085305.1 efflux RND transporter periplasmic adaptor subunit [Bacteroidota bacterium]